MTQSAVYQGGTLGEALLVALRKFRDRPAFLDGARTVTYQELHILIARAAARLDGLGVRKGVPVVHLTGNCVEQFAVAAACFIKGFTSSALHGGASVSEQAYAIDELGAAVLVVDDGYVARGVELLAAVKGELQVLSHGQANGPIREFWEPLAGDPPPLADESDPDDVIRVTYTGGTTGVPKGVMNSSRSLLACLLYYLAGQRWEPELKFLCAAPMSHGAGTIILPVLVKGGCVVVHQGFDPDKVLRAIASERITCLMAVPTMVYAMLDHPEVRKLDLSSLRRIMYGAAPISPARLREAVDVFGPVLQQGYGQSEAPATLLVLTTEDHLSGDEKRLQSAGCPYPGVTVRLLDDDCMPVAPGAVGEICVRGPLVMSGYWKKPEQTEEALRGGWLHTGDLAWQDDLGYFYIVDRRKDMIISGGFNVYPKEVENVLAQHPAVGAAAVIGVPDAKWGEAVKAFVVLRPSQSAQAAQLVDYVKAKLGSVKAPKTVELIDKLPVTSLGKVDKKALRAPYWGDSGRAVHG